MEVFVAAFNTSFPSENLRARILFGCMFAWGPHTLVLRTYSWFYAYRSFLAGLRDHVGIEPGSAVGKANTLPAVHCSMPPLQNFSLRKRCLKCLRTDKACFLQLALCQWTPTWCLVKDGGLEEGMDLYPCPSLVLISTALALALVVPVRAYLPHFHCGRGSSVCMILSPAPSQRTHVVMRCRWAK